jgi:1-acyl-sn-glycerol-3-phosphate acyltransferase
MGKLGNDPFQRGAAAKKPAAKKPAAQKPAARKPAGKKARPPAPKTAASEPPAPAPQVLPEARVPRPHMAAPPPSGRAPSEPYAQALQGHPGEGLARQVMGAARGLVAAFRTGLGTSGAVYLDDFGQDPALVRQLAAVRDFLYDSYWRIQVAGAQNVPAGPCLLVANHSGALPFDGPMLQEVLRRERPDLPEARWLVEDQLFYAPFLGTLLNRLGAVRASPQNANRLLEQGRAVLVFPEGIQGIGKPYADRYRLARFGRGGVVKLALRTRAPIVPVALVGAEEAMPLWGRLPGRSLGLPYLPLTSPLPLPSRWSVRFGEPVRIEQHPPEAADDLRVVQALNDHTREAVQGMLDALLKERPSVF